MAVPLVTPYISPMVLGGGLLVVLAVVGFTVIASPTTGAVVGAEPDLKHDLARTRRDYEALFSAVPCFICVQDREHRILTANELYREEFGADFGSRCWEVCKNRDQQCHECLVDRTFEDGQVYSSEEILIGRHGQPINTVVYTRPVYDNGDISAVMEVFTDITEVKKLQQKLALMGRAVAGMAHRVKNILMGLEGGIFVVNTGMESDDKEAIAEGWEMVERNCHRVSRIVKDLLYCAKDRKPKFERDVCPHDIVLEVRDLFADRMADEDIEFRTEFSDPPHVGVFDPEGIHSLLCNLVANAIDACRFDDDENKTKHVITLRCRKDAKEGTVLEVEDDGSGIPEEASEKVFEDFFSSKGSEGTGIGLLVVQTVAEEHGGKASFQSESGKGTTFTVNLPAA